MWSNRAFEDCYFQSADELREIQIDFTSVTFHVFLNSVLEKKNFRP
jgi:hypothetical protein